MRCRHALLAAAFALASGCRAAADASDAAAAQSVACLVHGAPATVVAERVNDDYCDCDGGEDEPATAACSHVLSSTFFCRNGGFFPRSIPTSRVGDGVCDCCDGSDERAGHAAHCADTCTEEAETFRHQALDTFARTQRGFELRQRAVDGKVREYFDDASQAARAATQTLQALEKLKTRVAEFMAREERKEAALRLAHARNAQAQTTENAGETVQQADTCVPDEAGGSTCREQTSAKLSDTQEFAEVDAHDLADEDNAAEVGPASSSEDEGSAVQRVKSQVELSDGTHVSLSEYLRLEDESRAKKQLSAKRKPAQKTPDQMRREDFLGPLFHGDARGRKRIALFALRALGVLLSPVRGVLELALFIPRTLFDLFVTMFQLDAAQLPRSPSDVFHTTVVRAPWFRRLGEGQVYRGYHLAVWSAQVVWDAPVFVYYYLFPRLDASIVSREAKSLRRVMQEIEDAMRALEEQRDAKRAAAATDFGPQRAYFALQDQCIERRVDKYTYKFCAFSEIRQDHTLLGKWDGWADGSEYTRMRFTGGHKCWNGPERSVVVQLECGEENEIVAVEEPSTCEYEMKVRSPLACTHEVLAAAQREVEFWSENKQ